MPEVSGTVKAMNKKGTGLLLHEYQNWWNFGRDYSAECARSFRADDAITLTYEEVPRPDGSSSFFLLEVWPTSTGKPAPQPAAPSGPVPTNGPKPAQPDSYDGYRATGPVPTPPSRENSILFQVCLKAAQEWVMGHESLAKTPAEVLNVADLYYAQGSRLINGEGLALEGDAQPQDGDPGPGPPA